VCRNGRITCTLVHPNLVPKWVGTRNRLKGHDLALRISRNAVLKAHVAALSAAIIFFSQAVRAQDSSPDQLPHTATLTVNARLVVLDVVVTDKAGNPVTDLKREDFSVFEDGKQQRIASFESPTAHVLPAAMAASSDLNAVFDAAKPAAFGLSPVTVLVLDQLNTQFADSSFSRRSLKDYLTTQPALLAQPTTLLTVYDNHFKLVKAYTRDRDALLRALAAEPTHRSWNLEQFGSAENGPIMRLDQSLRALEQIAQSTASIPGRKNLIWVGGGFPTLDPTTIDGSEATEVKDTIQHVTNTLLDAHVTMYAVDPKSMAAGMTEITDENQAAFAEAVSDSSNGSLSSFNSGEGFDRLAPITGGRVIRGMNDISHQIALSVELGKSFYTIGYSPSSNSDADAKYRHIRVDCKRAGLTLKTRDGYFVESDRQEKAGEPRTISYDLSNAAESTVPLNGLHITVERSTSVGAPPDSFMVHVGAANLTWKPSDDGSSSASVAVMSVYLDKKGKMIAHTLHGMTAHAREGVNLHDPAKTADFGFTVDSTKAAKAATLRFIVRDTGTGRMGSFDMPVK
jgi:VWFA-related protein